MHCKPCLIAGTVCLPYSNITSIPGSTNANSYGGGDDHDDDRRDLRRMWKERGTWPQTLGRLEQAGSDIRGFFRPRVSLGSRLVMGAIQEFGSPYLITYTVMDHLYKASLGDAFNFWLCIQLVRRLNPVALYSSSHLSSLHSNATIDVSFKWLKRIEIGQVKSSH